MRALRLSVIALLLAVLAASCVQGWWCPVVVGMPIRSELAGPISQSRAALLSAAVATDAAENLDKDWDGPDPLFCRKLVDEMEQLFRCRYREVGARVTAQ